MTFTLLDLSKCEQHFTKKWHSTVNSRERETVQWWSAPQKLDQKL